MFTARVLMVAMVMCVQLTVHADVLSEARSVPDARNTPTENWEGPHVREIMNDKDWDKVLAESKKAPVFVFKHSTECPVTAGAAYRTNAWPLRSTRSRVVRIR